MLNNKSSLTNHNSKKTITSGDIVNNYNQIQKILKNYCTTKSYKRSVFDRTIFDVIETHIILLFYCCLTDFDTNLGTHSPPPIITIFFKLQL